MPDVVFPLDSTKPFTQQQLLGHNRWHPEIPPAVVVRPGQSFRVHCREWFDGAIHNDDSADDIRDAPLLGVHVLSGPIGVEGARPGDLLVVDILDLGPIPQEDSGPLAGQGWGYTGIFPAGNGGGFLTESSRTPTRRSGTSAAGPPPHATSPTSRSPASCTPA